MRRTAVVLIATAALAVCAASCTDAERSTERPVGPGGSPTDRHVAEVPSDDQLYGSTSGSLPAALPADPADAYLEMVRPSNCALYRYQAAHASLVRDGRLWREDWERIRYELLPLSMEFATEHRRMLEAFQAYAWPDAVVEFQDAFEREARREVEWREKLNGVTTWATFQTVYARQPADERVGRDVRRALGLPPVGEDADPCVSTDDGTASRPE